MSMIAPKTKKWTLEDLDNATKYEFYQKGDKWHVRKRVPEGQKKEKGYLLSDVVYSTFANSGLLKSVEKAFDDFLKFVKLYKSKPKAPQTLKKLKTLEYLVQQHSIKVNAYLKNLRERFPEQHKP